MYFCYYLIQIVYYQTLTRPNKSSLISSQLLLFFSLSLPPLTLLLLLILPLSIILTITLLLPLIQPITNLDIFLIQVETHKAPVIHTLLTHRRMTAFQVQNVDLVVFAFQTWVQEVFDLFFWRLDFLLCGFSLAAVLVRLDLL